jgi:3-deoxy-D-manno-octulosonic-acid transferase
VTGSLKYDGAQTDCHNPRTTELRELAGIATDDIVLLAGSTQAPEEQIVLDIFQRLAVAHPRLRLVLVPRHPERFDEVAQLLDASGVAWLRRSNLDERRVSRPDTATNSELQVVDSRVATRHTAQARIQTRHTARVLLVDTVGELGAWWGTAHIAFVGGSFGRRGGQNMLEPAAYGAAVAFGPNTWNFRDIVAQLLAAEAAVVVRDAAELEEFVLRALDDPDFTAGLGQRAQALVASQLGATNRTIELLTASLSRQRPLAA